MKKIRKKNAATKQPVETGVQNSTVTTSATAATMTTMTRSTTAALTMARIRSRQDGRPGGRRHRKLHHLLLCQQLVQPQRGFHLSTAWRQTFTRTTQQLLALHLDDHRLPLTYQTSVTANNNSNNNKLPRCPRRVHRRMSRQAWRRRHEQKSCQRR